jgi:hypothetical protein
MIFSSLKFTAPSRREDGQRRHGDWTNRGQTGSSLTFFSTSLAESYQKTSRLSPGSVPGFQLIPNITAFYERKILLWKRMTEIGSDFIGGPRPGVDYGKLAAEMPQIRGQLDYIDHALFEVSPGIFATLIDLKEDSKGHASHLIITKEERAKLIDNLNTDFGTKLDAKDQNWTVSAASVLKAYLLKDFKPSDEPWE